MKTTVVPAQNPPGGFAAMPTLTGRFGLTVMQIEFEVAGFPLAQARFEVRMQVMQSPLTGTYDIVGAYCGMPPPLINQ